MTLLQTAEVAEAVGVTPDAIRRAAREGRINVSVTTGRGQQLYTREDVEAFAQARTTRRERLTESRRG